MNRIGVINAVADAVVNPLSFTAAQLAVTHGDDVVTDVSEHSFLPTSVVDLFAGLKDGSCKHLGSINPFKFAFSSEKYVPFANGKKVRVGYNGTSGNIVVADPSVSANVNKFGTLTISYTSLEKNTVAPWGNLFQEDIYIVAGDNTAAVLAKLVTALTKLVTKINAAFNTNVISASSDVASASKYLEITSLTEKVRFNVNINGIFEGTLVTTTVEGDAFKGGLKGDAVQVLEQEAAVLDGYNPVYVPKQPPFNLPNYVVADATKGYDIVKINTALPKEYDSPDAPTGWDVEIVVYCETGNNVLGTSATDLLAVLQNIKNIATGNFLTKAVADDLYAPKV